MIIVAIRIISPPFSGDFEIQTALAAMASSRAIIKHTSQIFKRRYFFGLQKVFASIIIHYGKNENAPTEVEAKCLKAVLPPNV